MLVVTEAIASEMTLQEIYDEIVKECKRLTVKPHAIFIDEWVDDWVFDELYRQGYPVRVVSTETALELMALLEREDLNDVEGAPYKTAGISWKYSILINVCAGYFVWLFFRIMGN